jgi:hypothetical protein
MSLSKPAAAAYCDINKFMKSKPTTTFNAGAAGKFWQGRGMPDQSISKAELLQSLQTGSARVVPGELMVSLWLDHFKSWLTEQLYCRIPEGYEDGKGFHYGPPPVPNPRG